MNWKHMTSEGDLKKALEESQNGVVIIFKHSTRCVVSKMALKMFEAGWQSNFDVVQPYFLDLLNHRDLCNYMAKLFDIRHESPQLLVIKGGKVIHYENHDGIDVNNLGDYI